MADLVLLISSDAEWCSSIGDELTKVGFIVSSCRPDEERRLADLMSRHCAAAVLWATPEPAPTNNRYEVVETLARRIRDAGQHYPILFLAVAPNDVLALLARRYEPSAVVEAEGLDATESAELLRAEWERLRDLAAIEGTTSATIEITLRTAKIGLEARIGRHVVDRKPLQEWGGGRYNVRLLNEEFGKYDLKPDVFRRVWQDRIESAGKSLWNNMIETPGFRSSIELVKSRVKMNFRDIHFRVIVDNDDKDLEHVPFEVVASDPEAVEYIRNVAPLARKLLLNPTNMLANPDPNPDCKRQNHPTVLFISADASGRLTVEGKTFKGEPAAKLGKLSHIGKERQAVLDVHGCAGVFKIDLEKAADPVTAMTTALQQGPWDVIHFAGHTIQADDDRQVFLALPDREFPGQLKGYSADDFAQRAAQARARLVVLSSCENCSCRSLLKMASFGVPAVIGFRWPVDDEDAASFTPNLHKALYQQKLSLMRAFQDAVFKLKENAGGRITPFSPILLIQPDSWHSYWLGE